MRKGSSAIHIVFMLVMVVTSCENEDSLQLATISTTVISQISPTTAITGGNITNSGGGNISARGVVWGTSPEPAVPFMPGSNVTSEGTGTGSFVSNLTGLTANTTYYVRAYAINEAGTVYGNELSFTTENEDLVQLATLSTSIISQISGTAAISGGSITSSGGGNINARGVVWNTSPNPTTANNSTTDGTGTGIFSSNLTGLTNNTTYYVRAYATNSAGTSYGNELNFTTSGVEIITNAGAGVTFDGYTYASIVLGNGQEWMAENLRTTVYANGDPIPNVTNNSQWSNLATGAWAYYNNDNLYENTYGKLYNFHTIINSPSVCPAGWHVPTDAEWSILTNYLGGINVAGGKMKSTSLHWYSPNQDATNESGFSGLPGGSRFSDGSFSGVRGVGSFWSSTLKSGVDAWSQGLSNASGSTGLGSSSITTGHSIRCVKD